MHKLLLVLFLSIFFVFGYNLEAAIKMHFEGSYPDGLVKEMENASHLKRWEHRPPLTFSSLKRRAQKDLEVFESILEKAGYFDGTIALEFLGTKRDSEVVFHLTPGIQYRFAKIKVFELSTEQKIKIPFPQNQPATSQEVAKAQQKIEEHLATQGYPFAAIKEQKIHLDQAAKEAALFFKVAKGSHVSFGKTQISGLDKVGRSFLKNKITWKEGEPYDPKKIHETEKILKDTGLFASVAIAGSSTMTPQGKIPLEIHCQEHKQRHLELGLNYHTDDSLGGFGKWSHSTFSGHGDVLSVRAEATQRKKELSLFYGLPDFIKPSTQLSLEGKYREIKALAFQEKEVSLLMRLAKQIDPLLSYSCGLCFERLLSSSFESHENAYLLSSPFSFQYERFPSPLHSLYFFYEAEPYQGLYGNTSTFFKQELTLGGGAPLWKDGRWLLFLNAKFGSIIGEPHANIPTPKRFFAGSSRVLGGYRYLTVSPLKDGKPVGGRSLFAFQIEPRFRITDALFAHSFYEMGNVYSAPLPQFEKKMLRSVGFGLDYMLPLGPLRVDIAFPIDRRKGIDPPFQIYASIGRKF